MSNNFNDFLKQAWKLIILVVGTTVVLIGIALAVLPIVPGWPLIFVGLGILAVEFAWARRLLKRAKTGLKDTMNWIHPQGPSEKPPTENTGPTTPTPPRKSSV